MEKQTKDNGNWWKTLILLTFIISLICLGFLIDNNLPEYEYETKIITLANTNIIERYDGRIVNHICDEGVEFNDNRYFKNFYASTWEGTKGVKEKYKGMTGTCMIKIRRRI